MKCSLLTLSRGLWRVCSQNKLKIAEIFAGGFILLSTLLIFMDSITLIHQGWRVMQEDIAQQGVVLRMLHSIAYIGLLLTFAARIAWKSFTPTRWEEKAIEISGCLLGIGILLLPMMVPDWFVHGLRNAQNWQSMTFAAKAYILAIALTAGVQMGLIAYESRQDLRRQAQLLCEKGQAA